MVTHKPMLGLGTRLGALAIMLAGSACWSDEPKIVGYDASLTDKLDEACKRPKVPRADGFVRLEDMECDALAFWPGFERDVVATFNASQACKGVTLISYQKLAAEKAVSTTAATKEVRWDFLAWPVWRWDGQRAVRDDRQGWFIIDSKSKASADGIDSLHDMATNACTFVNGRSS